MIKLKGDPIIFFTRTSEEKNNKIRPVERLYFKVFKWRQQYIEKLINDTFIKSEDTREPQLFVSVGNYWKSVDHGFNLASPNMDMLSPETKEIFNDVGRFIDKKQWYIDRNIKYKRGYMLHGVPGTGKSTIIQMLGAHFGLDIYYCKSQDFISPNVTNLLADVIVQPSIIVVEDIDSIAEERELEEGETEDILHALNKNSMGTILNALDGIVSYDGSIFVCTTNHIEKIDSAIKRPGRIDMIQEIKVLDQELIVKHINKFYETNYMIDELIGVSPKTIAELQNNMLMNETVEELFKSLKISLK